VKHKFITYHFVGVYQILIIRYPHTGTYTYACIRMCAMISGIRTSFLDDHASLECRHINRYFKMSVNVSSTNIYISSKIQQLMEEIITIIKAMDISLKSEDLGPYKRSLYRSMDQLTELKCNLLQQQVSSISKIMQ